MTLKDGNESPFEEIGIDYMKLIFGLGQDIFEQFCSAIKSPIVASDKKSETEFVELLSAALREDNVSSTLLHVLHVTLIGKNDLRHQTRATQLRIHCFIRKLRCVAPL